MVDWRVGLWKTCCVAASQLLVVLVYTAAAVL